MSACSRRPSDDRGAMEDLAQCLLEEGKPLPTPNPEATADAADLIELIVVRVRLDAQSLRSR